MYEFNIARMTYLIIFVYVEIIIKSFESVENKILMGFIIS